MHVFYTPDINTVQELPQDEAAHCLRVLRLTQGDEIMLVDGEGCFYKARITATGGKHCAFSVIEKQPQPPLWKGHLCIAMAPTKNMDRTEWFVEKATEIGVDEFYFLNTRYSERKVIKTERVEKIVVSAMKQSLKARKPVVHEMIPFRQLVEMDFPGHKFIAHCHEGEKFPLKNQLSAERDALVLIGPEGDFSEEEVALAMEHGFRPISLGPSRLRTETAALVAVHLMNLSHQYV